MSQWDTLSRNSAPGAQGGDERRWGRAWGMGSLEKEKSRSSVLIQFHPVVPAAETPRKAWVLWSGQSVSSAFLSFCEPSNKYLFGLK